MVTVRFIISLFLLMLCIPGAAAPSAGEIDLIQDKAWITAGESDTVTLTVIISNPLVRITGLTFSVESEYASAASFGPVQKLDETRYSTTFSCKKSGSPVITATLACSSGGTPQTPLTVTTTQQVDHAAPYYWAFIDFAREATTGAATPITVKLKDRYGNPVDSRREDDEGRTAETVTFNCVSLPGAGFRYGSGYAATMMEVPVDPDGLAAVLYRVSTIAGANSIDIKAPPPISSRLITITGISNAVPASIEAKVVPHEGGDPPYVPADGRSSFVMTYVMFDEFGNPCRNCGLDISTSVPGEEMSFKSNENGKVVMQYGPRDTVGMITIDAVAVDNRSVSVSTVVEFVSTDPVDMVLTASPQVMPSHDVDTGHIALLIAKVIDKKGNPVSGEEVEFSLSDIAAGPEKAADPYLVAPSAITDEDGIAVVEFVPGTFIRDQSDPDYNGNARMTCDATARWGGTSRTLTLEWMNFPYLSVETLVQPGTVAQNGTVQVTIDLIGNGYAIQSVPIDVVLCIDRSGSMLMDYPDRMVSTMEAARIFNSKMSVGRDQVGLVSFGRSGPADIYNYNYRCWAGSDSTSSDDSAYISAHYASNGKSYPDFATLDLGLSFNHAAVDHSIGTLVPMGGTSMRAGIYKAIKEIRDNGRGNETVRALVVLSDGDYNTYGDPLARGAACPHLSPENFGELTPEYYPFRDLPYAEQDMRVFAAGNDIRIYTVAFAGGISEGGRTTLRMLAEGTGGEYYYAPSGDDLAAVYTEIAGRLRADAGVNTTMYLDCSNIVINSNSTVTNDAANPVFEYEHVPGMSTTIESWNETHTMIPKYEFDQTGDWRAGRSLSFGTDTIGTIGLGQTWEVNYILNMTISGNINIFGPDSLITFNNGEATLSLPDTFVTVVPDLNRTGPTAGVIDVYDLRPLNSPPYDEYVDLAWNLNYTGTDDVRQELSWTRLDKDGSRKFATLMVPVSEIAGNRPNNLTCQARLDARGMASGSYQVRVVAMDGINPMDSDDYSVILINRTDRAYIRIE